MQDRFKLILFCSVFILICFNITACSQDDNKVSENTKASTPQVTAANIVYPKESNKVPESTGVTTQELQDANVELFCKVELKDIDINSLEEKLKNHKNVSSYKFVSKKEQAQKAGELYGIEKFFEGENADILPVSFIVKLKDTELIEKFYTEFKSDSRIDNIKINRENKPK